MSDMPPPPTPFESGSGGGIDGSSNPDARLKAAIAHVLPLADGATGILGTVGIIVMYFMMKDKEPGFVVEAIKQSLYMLVGQWAAAIIVIILSIVTCGIGGLLVIPVAIALIVIRVIAAMKSYNGENYRYPLVGNWTFLG